MAFEENIVDIFFKIIWTSIACTFSIFRLAYIYRHFGMQSRIHYEVLITHAPIQPLNPRGCIGLLCMKHVGAHKGC